MSQECAGGGTVPSSTVCLVKSQHHGGLRSSLTLRKKRPVHLSKRVLQVFKEVFPLEECTHTHPHSASLTGRGESQWSGPTDAGVREAEGRREEGTERRSGAEMRRSEVCFVFF